MSNYTVKKGDSLSKIAIKFGQKPTKYAELYAFNKAVIGKNPNFIKPGQVLEIPLSWSSGSGGGNTTPEPTLGPGPASAGFPLWLGLGIVGGLLFLTTKKKLF
jgi:hypothetical protein